MKGIVLAGGFGTRLYPLTKVTSKQLLPVYDQPMVKYPVATLISMGVTDIAIITTSLYIEHFKKILGYYADDGIKFTYFIQDIPNGIPDAFLICEKFIGRDNVALILGDNIFIPHEFDYSFYIHATDFETQECCCKIFGYEVKNPNQYGVIVRKDKKYHVVEKPVERISNFAMVGLYIFDNTVIRRAKKLIPSKRGELEIVDVVNSYFENENVDVVYLGKEFQWFDCGTPDDLLKCSNVIKKLKKKGRKFA